MDEIIGQGERLATKLLSQLFKEVKTQVPLSTLLEPSLYKEMGSRALKETLDIVVYRPKPLVVRIQDDRHKTKAFGIVDNRQRWELEASGCDVVDVWKEDCPRLFEEKKIDASMEELKRVLRNYLD